MGRKYILRIWNDEEIAVDPESAESLNWAKATISKGLKYHHPGEFKRTVADRQLADIEKHLKALN